MWLRTERLRTHAAQEGQRLLFLLFYKLKEVPFPTTLLLPFHDPRWFSLPSFLPMSDNKSSILPERKRGEGRHRGNGKWLLRKPPGTLRPSRYLHRREVTHCNATSASLKHFTWAPRPSAFRSRALLPANTTWHVLVVSPPDACVRPAGP